MRIDIGLDATGDLMLHDGDWAVGIADAQHIGLLVRLHKGSIKQSPLVGVGEHRFINGVINGEMRREIQLQLEADGYRVRDIKSEGEVLEIVV